MRGAVPIGCAFLLALAIAPEAKAQPLDVDADGFVDVATDIVYVSRNLLGLPPVPASFRATDPTIPPDAVIAERVGALGTRLDVDGDGVVNVATDLVYIARYLLGLVAVPPSFRATDPTIPSDEEIGAQVDALQVLGTRRFSLDPADSTFGFVLPGFDLPNPGFQGYFDLTGGRVDPTTGQAAIDITAASEYLVLDLNPAAPFTLCLRPFGLPVSGAGRVDCRGTLDLTATAVQNHSLGQVGVAGFTSTQCGNLGGTVESPSGAHPGVCNGPLTVGRLGEGPSPPGSVKIGLDAELGLSGFPVEMTVEESLPCGDEGLQPVASSLGFVTDEMVARIENLDNVVGQTLSHSVQGSPLECWNWPNENGPGRLVLALPALHGFALSDMISVFVFDD